MRHPIRNIAGAAAAAVLAACATDTAPKPAVQQAPATVTASYVCPLYDKRAGDRFVFKFMSDGRASLTIDGTEIKGVRDPVLAFTYAGGTAACDLSPDDSRSRQMGPMTYDRELNLLKPPGSRKMFACQSLDG